jgi:hypothetical protein
MNLHFDGTLTPTDNRRAIPYTFDVPAGVTEIRMKLDFAPRHTEGQPYPQQISLYIMDSKGPRGEWSVPKPDGWFVNQVSATPGTMPGTIPHGQWIVFILSHRIQPDIPVRYTLHIEGSYEPITDPTSYWQPGRTASRGAGWYRGDLHGHTIHSDGSWDIPEFVEYMHGHNLDFVTLSDHNTISGLAQHRSLANDELVTIGGVELSTFCGHALALGAHQWFDWRLGIHEWLTAPQLAEQVLNAGAFFVIAHPMAVGDPECCGCHWEHEDMMPGNAPAVEVWNGWWSEYNEQGLELYYYWLNQGHRLVATSGTDIHGRPPADARGRAAANVVYAEEFSEDGILQAIRRGHSYISAGPELLLNARSQAGQEAMLGDTLPASTSTVTARWSGVPDDDSVIRLIVEGRVYDERPARQDGELSWTLDGVKWCAVELRDGSGIPWAITNPIFFDVG